MIVLDHISRIYEVGTQHLHALDDISLTIQSGEYISIMGPSGSGKSTLLNVIGLLDRPSQGRYLLDQSDVTALTPDQQARVRREKIGFVFQMFHLIPRLNALQNVALPLMFAGEPVTQREQRALSLLRDFGLAERADHRPEQLSGGERQRVAIARAMVMRPSAILADEPTGNLDRSTGKDVIELLESLHHAGVSLLVVTHDPEIGKRAHRQLRMQDGKIVADETVESKP